MKTPMFVCLALTKASESLLTIGASEFLPKYTENQFILTSSEATIVSGNFSSHCIHFEIFI